MKKRTLLIALASMIVFCSTGFAQTETAQDMSAGVNQGGIGFQVGGEAAFGGHLFYNISSEMRLGTHIGFFFDGGETKPKNVPSTYGILFTPYCNFYFVKINSLSLFAQASFAVNSGSFSEYDFNRAEYVTTTSTTTQFNINLGGEWFPTKSKMISVFGGFNFLNVNLSPFRYRVGTGGPFIGINWLIF